MKRFILMMLTSFVPVLGLGQTTLSPGDLIILAINGDNDATNSYGRGFSFMPLVNLEAGTEIFFTDNGWSDNEGKFIVDTGISDKFVKYTAPGAITAGTVIRDDSYANAGFAFHFSYTSATDDQGYFGGLGGLSQSDEMLIFQGSIAAPNFIFAMTYVSTNITPTGWGVNVPLSGTDGGGAGSAVPGTGNATVTDLVDGVTALAFKCAASTNDNSAYVGATTPATKAEWLARVGNFANWTHNDAVPIPTPPTGPFVVSGSVVAPTVTSAAAASIAATSATLGGEVTADGGATVGDRGVVVSLSSANTDPRIGGAGVSQASIGSGVGSFSQSVGSLSRGVSYHFNAYAINSAGTNYGSVRSFTTLIPGMGLAGNGNAIASGAAASVANGTKFAMLPLGASWTNTFTITNNGTEALALSGFGISDLRFEIEGMPATVAVGGASDFTVKFAPDAAGGFAGTLTISNDSPTAAYVVNLEGSCFAASTNAGPLGGGNAVTFTNGNFGAITGVVVGGVAATILDSGASWVTVAMPAAGAAGAVDVAVQTSDNGETVLANAYAYNPAGWIIDSEILTDWSRWGEVEGMPGPLRLMDAAVLNGKIYVGGGTDATILTNFCAFDGTNWQNAASFPAVRRNVAFAALNGTLYSIGGHSAAAVSANVYAFNGTSWSSSVSLPAARTRMSAGVLNGKIYAVGGNSSTTAGTGMQTNVYAFDGTNWTEVAGLPLALEGMAVEELNGQLYSIGGGTNGVTNVFRFDGTEWTAVAGLPEPRSYMGSAAMDGKIYAVGGLYSWARTNVYAFDGTNWTETAPLPVPRRDLAAAELDGRLYAIGGAAGFTATNTVFAYPGTETVTGVMPSSGSWTGGYGVVITGTNFGNGTDITNVTLCGVAATITSQTTRRVWVVAAPGTAGVGDVAVQSTSYGTTVKSNAFEYLRGAQAALTFAPASPQAYASTNGLAVSGGSGTGAVSYAVTAGPGMIAGGTNLAVTAGSGTITLVATKAQDDLYFATAATATVAAAKADQTISFPAIGDKVTTDAVGLAATATSGLEVSFAVGAGPASISGGTNLTFTGAGEVRIVASQAGDANWNAAASATNAFNVAKDAATVYLLDLAQTYDGTARTISATTMPAGLTVAITYDGGAVAPTNAGSYAVTGAVNDAMYQGSAADTLVVAQANQTIAFPAIGDKVTTDAVGLAATATSGLEVSFAVGAGPASISGGTNLTFTGAGEVRIVASQAGDANWNAAASATNTFNVTKDAATVYLLDLAQIYDGTARTISATTMPAGLTVEFTYAGDAWAPTNAGSYAVTGAVNDAMYQGSAADTLVVARALDAIAFGDTNQVYDGAEKPVTATAGSGAPVALTYDGNAWAPTNAGVYAVTGIVDAANWEATNTATLTIGKADQTISFPAIGDKVATDAVGLAATATSGLEVSFAVGAGPASISGGTNLTFTGAGEVRIVASQAGDANWNAAASATNAFNVAKDAATVFLLDLAQTYDGTARTVTATTMPAGLTVAITYDGAAAAPTNAGSYAVAGTVDTAMYQGFATGLLVVAQANQTISFPAIGDKVTTDAVGLAATATSGLEVSFAVGAGPASISGGTNLTFTGAGEVRIVASQAGDANWNAAASATNTFNVTKDAATVYLLDLAQIYDGTARTISATTMPAGLTVEFTYAGDAWAPTNAGSYAVTGAVNDAMYQGSAADTLVVARALDAIAFGDTNQVYDGAEKPVTATAGSGAPVALTYDGNAWAPTNAGVYAVTGIVDAANWEATNTATLTIGKADQTIDDFLPADGEMFDLRETAVVSATASSGGAVEFANRTPAIATLVGTDITFIKPGLARVEASQAGDANWNPVSREHAWRVMNSQNALCDFDGDGRADLAVYHAAAGNWYIKESATGNRRVVQWGWSQSLPVPGDYDGDGRTDVAVYHPSSGNWFMACSSAGNKSTQWGWGSAVPVPGDYDGDGTTDVAVYDPIRLNWHLRMSAAGDQTVAWGLSNSVPVPADYDGDGVTDLATYRPATGTWSIRYRHLDKYLGNRTVEWGWSEAVPVPGDYDGDGAVDIAVFHRATGTWYLLCSATGIRIEEWGWAGTTPVAADYDGDGVTDIPVYHQAAGDWYLLESESGLSSGAVPFGWSAARPVLLQPLIHSWFGLP